MVFIEASGKGCPILGFRVDSGRFYVTLISKYYHVVGSAPSDCSRGPGDRKRPRQAEEVDPKQKVLTVKSSPHAACSSRAPFPTSPQLLPLLLGSL